LFFATFHFNNIDFPSNLQMNGPDRWITDYHLYLNDRFQYNLPFASRLVKDVYWPKVLV